MSVELDHLRAQADAGNYGLYSAIERLEQVDALRRDLAHAQMILEDYAKALPLLPRRALTKNLGNAYDNASRLRLSLWESFDLG